METEKKQINWMAIIVLVLLIVILIGAGYILNEKYIKPRYQTQGAEAGAINIINTINQNGQIPVINNNTIQWIPIQTICGGTG